MENKQKKISGNTLLSVSLAEDERIVSVELSDGDEMTISGAIVASMFSSEKVANIMLNAISNFISLSKNPGEVLRVIKESVVPLPMNHTNLS